MGRLSWTKSAPWPARFWSHVPVPSGDECMEFMGKAISVYGYGVARPPWSKNQQNAHRVMYTLLNGPIPKGMVVRHTCDNPPCVRPDHLVIGTQKDNVDDCIERGRFKIGGRVERGYTRKLSEEDARAILQAKQSGARVKDLALEYGVSAATAYNAIREIK